MLTIDHLINSEFKSTLVAEITTFGFKKIQMKTTITSDKEFTLFFEVISDRTANCNRTQTSKSFVHLIDAIEEYNKI